MDKAILNNLKPGEKAIDIQEYYWGKNGKTLVYKVIIYICKPFLFTKYISTYKFPFYFETKELATEYFQNFDKFEIYEFYVTDSWGDKAYLHYAIKPKGVNHKKLHHVYLLSRKTEFIDLGGPLEPGEIWAGKVNLYKECGRDEHERPVYYTEVNTIENIASKEGTTGKTYFYILKQV